MKSENKLLIKIPILIVLFCTYILPIAELSPQGEYTLPKLIFVGAILLVYIITLKKVSIQEIAFGMIIILMTVVTKDINYMVFMTLMFLGKFIKYKEDIVEYLRKSSILYICLLFTLFYSFLYSGYQGRYAFTAIKEVNQSGIAIFCLAMMLSIKSKKLCVFTLLFGMLTLSRSYFLAIICIWFFNTKFINKILTENLIRKFNYFNLTIFSSVLLFLLGAFYIYQYKAGNISFAGDSAGRLFELLDLSNYFRFTAVFFLVMAFKNNIFKLFTGMTDLEFAKYGQSIANELNILYIYTIPHNLFFSHLKIYGIFAIIELLYVSSIIKKIVNKKNFGIYLAIAFYSIFLGAGLYSYWLYLSVFALYCNSEDKKENIKSNSNEKLKGETLYGKS